MGGKSGNNNMGVKVCVMCCPYFVIIISACCSYSTATKTKENKLLHLIQTSTRLKQKPKPYFFNTFYKKMSLLMTFFWPHLVKVNVLVIDTTQRKLHFSFFSPEGSSGQQRYCTRESFGDSTPNFHPATVSRSELCSPQPTIITQNHWASAITCKVLLFYLMEEEEAASLSYKNVTKSCFSASFIVESDICKYFLGTIKCECLHKLFK